MIVSAVLVCQGTPQDTRLIVICSPSLTRPVLLIMNLSASLLPVPDDFLGRRSLTHSELVYWAKKKHLYRKAYWLLWEHNYTEGSVWSEHIVQISKLRWFCVWMCMLHMKWITSKRDQWSMLFRICIHCLDCFHLFFFLS